MLRPRALPAPPAALPTLSVRTRWLWVLPLLAGLLAVFGWTVAHDPGPGLALSNRGWVTVGLAVLLALLLGRHRAAGSRQLAAALAQYAAVATLTLLLALSPQAPAKVQARPVPRPSAQALDLTEGCGSVSLHWVKCLWDRTGAKARQLSPTSTTGRPR